VSSLETSETSDYRRIGTVARESGVATDTIRAWERRYKVVTPVRGPKDARYYSAADLRRLTMIKGLVAAGEAISRVSALEDCQLLERFQALKAKHCRVWQLPWVIVSRSRPDWLRRCVDSHAGPGSGWLTSIDEVYQDEHKFFVIDMPSLSEDHEREIVTALPRAAERALVLYQFASRAQLRRLSRQGYRLLKGPLEACALANHLSLER